MKKSNIPFNQLKALLEGLGFQGHRQRGHWTRWRWYFEHAPSGAEFIFRYYRPNEYVYAVDLATVQSHLVWRGLMTPEAFDHALTKTPA